MELHNKQAKLFMPRNISADEAFTKTESLCICAHQDDAEMLSMPLIIDAFRKGGCSFGAVVMTDGAGSPRTGDYGHYTNEQMTEARVEEQCKAAILGDYSFVGLLMYPSGRVKDPGETATVEELAKIISACNPETVITHNPADKHDTHVSVMLRTLAAIRSLPKDNRPKRFLGGELWRSLDWVTDDRKLVLDVKGHTNMQAALVELYDSQVSGGKRYDQAFLGRLRANATFLSSHAADVGETVSYSIDMTPLIQDDDACVCDYIESYIKAMSEEISSRLGRLL